MKQSVSKPTVTTAKKGTLHKCLKCRRQLDVPGRWFCQTKTRDCRPKANEYVRETNTGGVNDSWQRAGSQTDHG